MRSHRKGRQLSYETFAVKNKLLNEMKWEYWSCQYLWMETWERYHSTISSMRRRLQGFQNWAQVLCCVKAESMKWKSTETILATYYRQRIICPVFRILENMLNSFKCILSSVSWCLGYKPEHSLLEQKTFFLNKIFLKIVAMLRDFININESKWCLYNLTKHSTLIYSRVWFSEQLEFMLLKSVLNARACWPQTLNKNVSRITAKGQTELQLRYWEMPYMWSGNSNLKVLLSLVKSCLPCFTAQLK